MFDNLLIITLFLLASVLACLLTLGLSINIKHLSFFSLITDINGFFEIPPPLPPVYFDTTSFIKFNKNLRPPRLF